MVYSVQKAKAGKEPVQILEIDVRACSLTYGTGACTASGAAGTECFNSFATCQDQGNYANATKTFRFSSVPLDGLQGTGDAPTFPTLVGVSTTPTVLTPAKGFGIRSKVTVNLMDMPWSDVGIDKYRDNRTYNPLEQGSFWSKFMSRWPFYENNEIRIKTGYLDDNGNYDASNFITRTYFLDTIAGPDKNGRVSIVGKDILKFADGEKANIPSQSQATLLTDITAGATSFDIVDPQSQIVSGDYIRVDEETMLITNRVGDTLTVTRAAMPSVYSGKMTAEEHSEGSTVQHCHFFNAEQVDDILYYLLNTGAGIPASYLPTSEWQDTIDFGLENYLFTALITEPTPVKDLVKELTEHSILVWYDEREQKVKMDSIMWRAVDYGPFNDDSHIIADSVGVARDDKSRFSQAWLHYGLRTPVSEMDELKNYAAVKLTADLDAEGVNEYYQSKIRKIFSRWLPLEKQNVASEIANRLVNYYRDTKNAITFSFEPKDDSAWTGDRLELATRLIQDQFGATSLREYRVISVRERFSKGIVSYDYTAHSTGGIYEGSVSRYGVITPNSMGDYPSETLENKSRYAFVAYDDRGDGNEGFPTLDRPYLVL